MKIVKKNIKGAYGMVDLTKKKIYVNPKKNKTKGELLDTIVHEKIHIKHQKMSEKLVRETTAKELAHMKANQKNKLISKYKKATYERNK